MRRDQDEDERTSTITITSEKRTREKKVARYFDTQDPRVVTV
jgi:hypothetical protein